MIQRRGGPGLGQETLTQLAIFCRVISQELERHAPLQLVVAGEIDNTEAAQTKDFLDAVATDAQRYRLGGASNGVLLIAARLISICLFEVVHGSSHPSPTYSGVTVASHDCTAAQRRRPVRIDFN
jgi:hypothetical protein